jgi:hypothetical protein
MDKLRKKNLLLQYKHSKTEMGVFVFECSTAGKSYIGHTNDTKGTINSNKFKLGAGMHPNKELQKDWNDQGEASFIIEILEVLPYDEKDEIKTDYTKELEALRDKWIEKIKDSKAI